MTTTIEKTSDYLTTDELKRLNRYFQKEQNYQMALLIEFGFRTLLRYSDISRFTWENVLNKDELVLNEKKTGKKVFPISSVTNKGQKEILITVLNVLEKKSKDEHSEAFAEAIKGINTVIIDEVHMLTKEAFNALLKTLEEPPSHAFFILATTEAHKIPETIVSRCQQYTFKRISESEIVDRLAFIAEEEGVKTDDEQLRIYTNMVTRSLFGNINASRNSA